ncbi:E3 ubiquitin-protein ligase TRIM39-like [Sphaeramia orbicularis]|uniref:E3 ubiquitin-protein ligase TRIM39-like n=1 Tax=Sphaeramia orbicularis TaxID=375764 RepID=A0A673BUA4_9TELE|nr:E3 ubiquitin-protein ligase TRIM39-like [Sphaeramia orbicularis]
MSAHVGIFSERFNMSTLTVNAMASVPPQEQFYCCICLDFYSDPVSLPCAHNFCLDCIEGYWDTKDKPECPLCKTTFSSPPVLKINHGFADVIDFIKRFLSANKDSKADVVVPPGSMKQSPKGNFIINEVFCDICHTNPRTAVNSCLVCQASYCEIHLVPHRRDRALQKHRMTDPATFSTSHLCRNHNKPLEMFCKTDQTPVCVDCTQMEHKNHKIVSMEKASKRIRAQLKQTKANIHKMIEDRLRKVDEIKHSVDESKKTTEKQIQSSVQVCTILVSAIERQQTGLVKELKRKQEEVERKAEELLKELEEEMNKLQMRSSELGYLELTQNPLHLLQSFPCLSKFSSTRNWSDVTVHSDNCIGEVRRAVSKLMDVCQELINKLSVEEVDCLNQYSADVTLDPVTASGWLVLSPDQKKVHSQKKKTPVPDNPKRFDSCVCVLGQQSFTSGRRYWVVQVGDKTDWDLGVAKESINRKGAIKVRPDCGYWAICRRKGGSLSACADPSVTVNLKEIPQKVGIFLDYEEGVVSFFDAEAKAHIYTYSSCSFTESLCPYFNPCVQENEKNSIPLVICPVEGQIREGPGQELSVITV